MEREQESENMNNVRRVDIAAQRNETKKIIEPSKEDQVPEHLRELSKRETVVWLFNLCFPFFCMYT
jgi:hypothetical protein